MGWSEQILLRGYWQKGIYSVLLSMVTNFNATLLKLDNDGAVTDANFRALLAVTTPSIGGAGCKIQANGMYLGDVVLLLKALRDNFNTLMDKLANDGGVNGTTAFTTLKFSTTALLIDESGARVMKLGAFQADITNFLDQWQYKFARALDVLDTDSGVTDTDYFALGDVLDVIYPSSSSSSCRSSSSSSCSSSSCSSSSSSSKSSSSSSSSSCRSSSSSSRSSSSSSRSSSSSSSSCRSSSSSSSSVSSSSSSSSSRSSSSSSSSCSSSSCSSSCSSSSSSSKSSSSSSSSKSSSSSSCRSSSSSSSSSTG